MRTYVQMRQDKHRKYSNAETRRRRPLFYKSGTPVAAFSIVTMNSSIRHRLAPAKRVDERFSLASYFREE